MALRPGKQGLATDVCVPISRLADCMLETQAGLDTSCLIAPLVGHVGDGNFHLVFLIDPNDAEGASQGRGARSAGECARSRWTAPAPASTASAWASSTLSPPSTARRSTVMRTIKHALDPHNIMNPGKTVPM